VACRRFSGDQVLKQCPGCAQLIDKIALKRAAVEKELSGLGKAPKDIKDILHQCRGFERAFNNAVDVRCSRGPAAPSSLDPAVMLQLPIASISQWKSADGASQSVEISSQIRRTFNSIEGLTGAVDKLPVEQRFQLANVKAVRPSIPATSSAGHPPLFDHRLYGTTHRFRPGYEPRPSPYIGVPHCSHASLLG